MAQRQRRKPMSPSDRAWFDEMIGPMYSELYRAVGENLQAGRPIELELFASHLVGMWQSFPVFDHEPLEVFAGAVIRRARKRAGPEAYALLAGLAAVAPPTLDRRARAGMRELSRHRGHVPAWVGQVGRARFVDGYAFSDRYGDQTSVVASFAHDGEPEHTIVVLVDHNLGGMVKDTFVSDSPLGDVVAAWDAGPFGDGHDTVRERLEAAEVVRRLRLAFEVRDRCLDPPDSETMRDCAALLAARLRGLPKVDAPEPTSPSEHEPDRLVHDFFASDEARRRLARPRTT